MLNEDTLAITLYAFIMVAIWMGYARFRNRQTRRNKAELDAAKAAGLAEPASLHPVIDHARCIGCASCIDACPEKTVLGLIHGKAELINPASCIGHGACRTACPTQGITLVFGTEKRGVDIPLLKPNFETNVPGLFIAGELGGMGLIRNAVTQGQQAMEAIANLDGMGKGGHYDSIIVGAGPAGIGAALKAKQLGLRYLVIEQDSLGGTVSHYPRGKLVMTAPVELPLVGKVRFTETTKEELLQFWCKITAEQELNIYFNERMDGIEATAGGFAVKTTKGVYQTRSILLAIGRRGTPRKLDVPGEELPKVVYRLIDPEQYRGQKVVVVGGGDSALEAAWSIAEQPGASVILSYRSDGFARAKQKNRERVAKNEKDGRLRVMLSSTIKSINEKQIVIEQNGQARTFDNDAVIVCAGGILPTPFLKSIGIEVETKFGTA
ncbi:MAG: NAD(P)-binding domain-containing protein [Pseudomonadota bacterium]